MKLKSKLDNIRKMYPKGPTVYGEIYAGKRDDKKRFKRVTLYTLFVSDENTHLLRPHVFETQGTRNAKMWAAWFAAKLQDIHEQAVLPGIGVRTNKSWAVKQILGWAAHVKHKSNSARMDRKGHKTKSQRVKNGQANIRRRYRNGKRKAK